MCFMKSRIFRFDNAKFLLIFLVIFGHLMEQLPGGNSSTLYKAIYLFHMPAFLFLTGYFSSFNPKKILFRMALPYVVFQTLYLIFDAVVLKQKANITLNYTTPYWIMWYLLAIIFYSLLIPLLDTDKPIRKAVILAVTVVLSLLAGYVRSIGYYLSLSRIFTFAPYFVGGYYCKAHRAQNARLFGVIGALISVIGILYIRESGLSVQALYGSYSYASAGYTPAHKLALLVIGFGGVLSMGLLPDQKIPVVSQIGKNTMPIYCLHGFVVRSLGKIRFFHHSRIVNLALAVGLALLLMAIFGSDPVSRAFAFIFPCKQSQNPKSKKRPRADF